MDACRENKNKVARYRAQAAQYRYEAEFMAPGSAQYDKLAFAEQWKDLADSLKGRTKLDLKKPAFNDP